MFEGKGRGGEINGFEEDSKWRGHLADKMKDNSSTKNSKSSQNKVRKKQI